MTPSDGGPYDDADSNSDVDHTTETGTERGVDSPSARDDSALPDSWTVWSDGDDGRCVFTYRPDVFDAADFPAPCLPTLYLTSGKRSRRPGANPNDRIVDENWYVTLYLEPDVSVRGEPDTFPTREDALTHAISLARRFDDGEIDYRAQYQVPREHYLEKLDELTGRGREA